MSIDQNKITLHADQNAVYLDLIFFFQRFGKQLEFHRKRSRELEEFLGCFTSAKTAAPSPKKRKVTKE